MDKNLYLCMDKIYSLITIYLLCDKNKNLCDSKKPQNISVTETSIEEIIAQRKDIETLYNNPCYEYWLLLYTKSTAQEFINSEQCCKEAMKAINNTYGTKFKDLDKFKSAENIFDIVKNDLPKAIQNAKSLKLDDYNSTYTNALIIFEEIIKNTQNNS